MSTESLQEKFGAAGLKGGRAEEWLFDKLTHVYDEVIDLREDWKAQTDGIDFGIKKDKWHNPYYLDCKGNLKGSEFYIEYEKTHNPGWFWKSKSDRIYHVDVANSKACWYSLPEMRHVINQTNCCIGPMNGGLCRLDANDTRFKGIIQWMW
tara:strand:+ start:124 stop:576 length:453 start_codon:yes stop_codon:yes gene_type:complete